MYIQNYNELDGGCKKLAEYCGLCAEAALKSTNPPRLVMDNFRTALMTLSKETGRPIEVCDVRGEIWINIRERKPIPKEAIEAFILGNCIDEFPDPNINYKPVRAIAPTVNMADRIKSQWRW